METPIATAELVSGPAPLRRRMAWQSAPWVPAAAVALGYYFGALLGFAWRFPGSGISFFWPPTAVLTAALLLNPTRVWGWLLASAFAAHAVAHAQNGVPATAWPIQFLANATQAMLSAWLVRRFSDPRRPFGDLHRALGFMLCACVIGPAVASVIPLHVYVSMGWSPDALDAWRFRTVSNGIAALILVPAIVMIWAWLRSGPKGAPAWRVAEFVLVFAGLVASHAVLRVVGPNSAINVALALYAPAPFLLWATVRFGGAGLSLALLCTTLLTGSSALQGGAFPGSTPGEAIVGVQLFLSTMAVPLILIAGLLEQNQAEHRSLVEMEQQNSATLRALPDLMFLQSRDGVYLKHYTPSNSALLAPPEAFLGKNMREILPPEVTALFEPAFKSVTPDEPSVVEYSLEINGKRSQYEARLIGLDDERVLSIVRDITARRQADDALREAQRRYTLATAAGGVGLWHLDVSNGTVQVEGGLLASLGYPDGEVGEKLPDWFELISPDDVADVQSRLDAHLSGASPAFDAEFRMISRDGSVTWIHSRGAGVEWVDGAVARVTGTYTDITLRKEAEDALKHANDAMVRMGRVTALAELTASIAHELNQPLAAIATNANTCLRWMYSSASDDDLRAALKDLVADSRRAGQIVRRTREMFANRSVSRKPIDLNGVIRNVLDLVRTRLRDAGVQLQLELDESLPVIEADKVQMQQVVMNLVVNAVDAMLEAESRPRILSVQSRSAEDGVLVSVRDTGSGVSTPNVEQVFEPFYTTKADGIGIGLAISRSIVEAHGGSIWASTEGGPGATFSFTLPIHAQAEAGVTVPT
jgi:PAS domain S-box-containing protein